MNMHCTARVVHKNLEIYWIVVVQLFCIYPTVMADKLLTVEI